MSREAADGGDLDQNMSDPNMTTMNTLAAVMGKLGRRKGGATEEKGRENRCIDDCSCSTTVETTTGADEISPRNVKKFKENPSTADRCHRKVRFALHSSVAVTSHVDNDVSSCQPNPSYLDDPEEIRNRWYQSDDFRVFRGMAEQVAKHANRYGLSELLEGTFTESHPSSSSRGSEDPLVKWCRNGHNRRGLEQWTLRTHAHERLVQRKRVVSKVLQSQHMLSRLGVQPEVVERQLAQLSSKFSKNARSFAQRMGKADAEAALQAAIEFCNIHTSGSASKQTHGGSSSASIYGSPRSRRSKKNIRSMSRRSTSRRGEQPPETPPGSTSTQGSASSSSNHRQRSHRTHLLSRDQSSGSLSALPPPPPMVVFAVEHTTEGPERK